MESTSGRSILSGDRQEPEMAKMIETVASHVVPNGVDTEVFRPIERSMARQQLGLESESTLWSFPWQPR